MKKGGDKNHAALQYALWVDVLGIARRTHTWRHHVVPDLLLLLLLLLLIQIPPPGSPTGGRMLRRAPE